MTDHKRASVDLVYDRQHIALLNAEYVDCTRVSQEEYSNIHTELYMQPCTHSCLTPSSGQRWPVKRYQSCTLMLFTLT